MRVIRCMNKVFVSVRSMVRWVGDRSLMAGWRDGGLAGWRVGGMVCGAEMIFARVRARIRSDVEMRGGDAYAVRTAAVQGNGASSVYRGMLLRYRVALIYVRLPTTTPTLPR